MFDTGKIIGGILIFAILLSSPIWYNLAMGESDEMPQLEIVTSAEKCIMPTEYMRAEHMDLLNTWRDAVVRGTLITSDTITLRYRDGNRPRHVDQNGREHEISLTKTCMDCHSNKENFCDRCHDYSGVSQPDCWSCHFESP